MHEFDQRKIGGGRSTGPEMMLRGFVCLHATDEGLLGMAEMGRRFGSKGVHGKLM